MRKFVPFFYAAIVPLLLVSFLQAEREIRLEVESPILFTSKRSGTNQLYKLEEGKEIQLTATKGHSRMGKWSPDRSQILFYTEAENDKYDLYLIDTDGQNLRQLTTHPANDSGGSWSPDGKQIAFHSDRSGDDELYLLNLETEALIQLTNNPGLDWRPSFSPDGMKLVFSSERDGNEEVYLIDLISREQTRLTFAEGRDGFPSFSKDGLHILFHSERTGTSEVFEMDFDGGNQQQITRFAFNGFFPSYATIGSKEGILFSSEYLQHNDWDIFFYDYKTPEAQPIKLIDSDSRDYQPSVN